MTPFVGPSYPLGKPDSQRSINLYLSQVESGTGKAAFILKSIPGLSVFANPANGAIRGRKVVNGRAFVVAGNKLYEIMADGTHSELGTLNSFTGRVSMDAGVTQLVIVDGPSGYVLTLIGNAFAQITSPNFYGSRFVGFLSGYFCFIRPDTQQYYISDIDNALDLDALDFASAEISPDKLVALLSDHSELKLAGVNTMETAVNTPNADFPLQRNSGAFMEVGCVAPDTFMKLDNSIYWIGQNEDGGGMVYRANGYTPQIISNDAYSAILQGSTDLSAATAYGFQYKGHTFYCINAPGVNTTLAYEVKSGQWFEMAELVNGEYTQHRATGHMYAFGKNLLTSDDGKIYKLDDTVFNNAGDELVRDRISPQGGIGVFPRFVLDCTVGVAVAGQFPQVMMRYSNDGGKHWSNWMSRSLGVTGAFAERVEWLRCGQTRQGGSRCWQVRVTDDVQVDIISGKT